jgi:carbonic anhydrase
MSAADELMRANDAYASSFPGPRPVRPGRHLAVVACMDSRLDLFAALGLQVGDAHVIRNAGGIATDDVLRSLAISQRLLGTSEIVLVHHTECGMLGFDDVAFRAELEAASGQAPPWDVPGFQDAAADVQLSINRIRGCAWLPHRDDVRGFVFDVATGRIAEVHAS